MVRDNTRRELLGWLAVTGVVGSTTGIVGARGDTDEDEAGDGEGFVTEVIAGPDGAWRFEPEDVVIGLGETVEWYFDSPGHNVTAHPDAADGTSVPEDAEYFASYEGEDHFSVDEEGSTYVHTFTVPGEYVYVCTPHVPQMVGTVTVEPCVDGTVVVAPDGEEVFEPDTLEVDLGHTVEWVLEDDGHTVSTHPDLEGTSVPEEADPFTSYPDDDHDDTLEEGETVVHTFEVPGEYEYVCSQHEGMTGTVEVGDEPAAEVAVGPDGETVFEPADLEVTVGEVVRWRAEDDGHTVSAYPDLEGTSVPEGVEPFTSYEDDDHEDTLEEGETFDHRFVGVGEYEYVCSQHEGMTGSVTVGPCPDGDDES